MDLDIILEADLTPSQIEELSLLAEQFGFRGIWAQNYARARDAFMTMVPAALATKKIRVGVVIVSPYEMHPVKIANAVLTLNECSGGRAMVVIGAGGEWPLLINSAVFDSSFTSRIASTREALEIVKAAVGGRILNYEGENYQALGFSAPWHDDTPPLIYDGASGPKMLKMATGVADGVMMSDMHPEMLGDRMTLIRDSLAEHGRDGEDFLINNFVAWHIKKDREASREEARRELIIRGWLERDWLEPYIEPDEVEAILANKWPFLKAFRERHGNIEGVPGHVVDALVEGLSLSGDESDIDRHVERLRELAAAGFTEIALRIHDDPADSIRMIGEKVLPAL